MCLMYNQLKKETFMFKMNENEFPFCVKVSSYPSISFEKAQNKVKKSLENMTPSSGEYVNIFFKKLFKK